jgi:hypothetical protein
MLRPITISSPGRVGSAGWRCELDLAVWLASWNDCWPPCATPPMWKVRIVSCVPGSPMDCAAMMPTASPVLTMVPRARSRP